MTTEEIEQEMLEQFRIIYGRDFYDIKNETQDVESMNFQRGFRMGVSFARYYEIQKRSKDGLCG